MRVKKPSIRRAVVGAVVAVLAAGGLTVLSASGAFAHGTPTAPGSRAYLCYDDGHWTGGDLDPRNAACQAAYAVNGKQPFWDWYGVLRSDGGGRMSGFIPDGQLCSGGNSKYAGLDVARNDWPATHLTSGGKFTVHYAAWAPHPGQMRLFVTKDGYDPSKALTWNDLESQPFSTWNETTPNGNGEYYWDVTLPSNKTGRHIIYSVWARTDSQETFYGCSDVVFDGGTGLVTGYPNATGGTGPAITPSPTTPAVTSPVVTTPVSTTPVVTTPGTTTDVTTPVDTGHDHSTAPSSTCTALVAVTNSWQGGYQGTVTVLNNGAALNPWKVTWAMPTGATVNSGWNATVSQSGTTVTAAAPSWSTTLATGKEVSIGFVANGPSSPPPSNVQLNGVACNGTGSTPTTPVTTPVTTTPAVSSPVSSTPAVTTPVVTTPVVTTPSTGGGVSDGFETQTGSTPSGLWVSGAADCSGTGSVSIDRTTAHTGSASLKVSGATGYCNHTFATLNSNLLSLGSTVYARMFVRHTTALPTGHVTFAAFTDDADGGKDLRIGGQNQALQWNRQSDDATLPAQSPNGVAQSKPLPTGQWTCLEVMVNGSAGTADTWLDGTLVPGLHADGTPTTDIDGQWYGKSWHPSVSKLKLGWESYSDGADTLWFDDVKVSSSRIGCTA